MAHGYMGKMLWVDLSTKELRDEAFDEDLGATIWKESGLQLNIFAIPAERRHIATGDFR